MLVTFDTHEYVKNLTSKGFTTEQADALAEAQKKVMSDSMENSIATKGDIYKVTTEIQLMKARLEIVEKTQWIIIAGVLALVLKAFLL